MTKCLMINHWSSFILIKSDKSINRTVHIRNEIIADRFDWLIDFNGMLICLEGRELCSLYTDI